LEAVFGNSKFANRRFLLFLSDRLQNYFTLKVLPQQTVPEPNDGYFLFSLKTMTGTFLFFLLPFFCEVFSSFLFGCCF